MAHMGALLMDMNTKDAQEVGSLIDNYGCGVDWLQQAVLLGDMGAAVNLASHYLSSPTRAGEEECGRILGVLEKAAAAGDRDAQFALGQMCARGVGRCVSVAESIHWLGRAATGGHQGAQFVLRDTLTQVRCESHQLNPTPTL